MASSCPTTGAWAANRDHGKISWRWPPSGDTRGRLMRAVVVGASTGLGRCIGIGLARRGAQVALLARRNELLADAASEAGPGALAITCDVTDEAACQAAVDRAVGGLGGIDALVYAAGIGVLSP